MGIAGFYGLTKAGLNFLTSALAHELGGHDIRVNAIAPRADRDRRLRQAGTGCVP
jgi:NAD(P)-dependent dehydrogenase (short-subunit alcohol dehydrogenase family)